MSKSLMVIASESLEIERMIIENFGELTPEIIEKFTINQIETKEKLDAYDVIMDRFELNEQYFKQKADSINVISKAFKVARETMRERLKAFMLEKNLYEIKGSDVRFIITDTQPSLKLIPNLIAPEYTYQVVSTEIDKTKIKADLKDGKEVLGAELVGGTALRKYNIGVK
jgi:hypothetical protein